VSKIEITRGIGISTYNRGGQIRQVVEAVVRTAPRGTLIVVADDGSTDSTHYQITGIPGTDKTELPVVYIRGNNRGVVANKNRLLTALRGCSFLAIMEDDLIPQEKGWFEIYEKAALNSGIHHFCRVQGKEVSGQTPDFDSYMVSHGYTPLYSSSCRGDLVFISRTVLERVGGLNPNFWGVGYGHLEWAERISKSGLIPHPHQKWIDIKEARDKFIQLGDTQGGRFDMPEEVVKKQLEHNLKVLEKLQKTGGKLFQSIHLE
jgi:glycosyltransferase involved in cell wall biosynthesis